MSYRGLLPMLTLLLVACEQPVELGVDVEPSFAKPLRMCSSISAPVCDSEGYGG